MSQAPDHAGDEGLGHQGKIALRHREPRESAGRERELELDVERRLLPGAGRPVLHQAHVPVFRLAEAPDLLRLHAEPANVAGAKHGLMADQREAVGRRQREVAIEARELLFQLEQPEVDAATAEEEDRAGPEQQRDPPGRVHFFAASAPGGWANVIRLTMSLSRLRRISSSSAVVLL